ncbi:glycosyl transferase family 1 [Mycobacterium sp. IS-1742]|uniref:glycosyltransferase n=1 Tax=Mycobacterium sp. IS-1742 TaxID=1772285 RepID=UPI00074008F9|nr:glycosyltransferase [Mycobacterium sp. IS-1742]KUI23820.1 glycosyl transferase family 1 [Mycobacterium sp. IS-1742]
MTTAFTVVHVTESFASGTAAAIRDFARNYPSAEHRLVYARRAEASVSPAEFVGFAGVAELPDGHVARLRFLRRYARGLRGPVVIHAHSSKGGVYARVALRRSARRPIVYSPHCYAFERRDVGTPVRAAFRAAEWALSLNTSGFGVCSPREAALSRWPLARTRVVTVPNVAGPCTVPSGTRSAPTQGLCVVGNGRLGPQKDPGFFADAVAHARSTHPDLRAVWIGDGDAEYVRYLTDRQIEVTGWLPRSQALAELARGDVYLHTAVWEGLPISILEADAAGLPVVARARPYLEGLRLPLTVAAPSQFADVLTSLGTASARAAARDATRVAFADNCDGSQQVALKELYGPYAGAR